MSFMQFTVSKSGMCPRSSQRPRKTLCRTFPPRVKDFPIQHILRSISSPPNIKQPLSPTSQINNPLPPYHHQLQLQLQLQIHTIPQSSQISINRTSPPTPVTPIPRGHRSDQGSPKISHHHHQRITPSHSSAEPCDDSRVLDHTRGFTE